jgi:hypothetical protein
MREKSLFVLNIIVVAALSFWIISVDTKSVKRDINCLDKTQRNAEDIGRLNSLMYTAHSLINTNQSAIITINKWILKTANQNQSEE